MAKKKKSRVPAPPRPVQTPKRQVQAPRRRVEQRAARGGSRMWLFALIGALVVAAGAVGIAMAFRGGNDAVANGADGPCMRQTFPPQGRQHVQELGKDFKYSSFPPTSGPHFPVPAVYNIYDQSIPEIRLVHNLEHGAIVVQYGSKVPASVVQQIAQWYAKDPIGMVVAPLPTSAEDLHATPPPDADKKIYLTAWTHLASCSTFDEGAFSRFRDDYRGPKGDNPEKYPLSELKPGGT